MSPAQVAAEPRPAPETAPAAPRRTRPFYWSVRRELWENRSLHLAPLGVAAFALVALVTHAVTMPSHMPGLLADDPATPGSAAITYRVSAMLMLVTALVVGAFYCLDAMSGERRDRGILFWKSMPVSDRTTVLSKASIPLAVLPLLTFAAIVALHVALMLLSVATRAVQGQGPGPLWREVQLLHLWPALLYGLLVATLWQAPVYAFLLLVSGWARRTAALWVVLPLLAVGVLEKLIFDTAHVPGVVLYRLFGWHVRAFHMPSAKEVPFSTSMSYTPLRFLLSPDLWIGLALTVAFLAAAVRLRRLREPI